MIQGKFTSNEIRKNNSNIAKAKLKEVYKLSGVRSFDNIAILSS